MLRKFDYKHRLYKLSFYLPVLFNKPDIFHIQWVQDTHNWIWLQEFGVKLVVSLRGSQINWVPLVDSEVANIYRKVLPRVDRFHAVSRAIAEKAQLFGADLSKTSVVYSGLDLGELPFIPNLFRGKGPLQILSVGRPHWTKGFIYGIDAMKHIHGDIDFIYTVIGGKSAEYEFQVIQLGLTGIVKLVSTVNHIEVIELMMKSHLFLLPSVEEGIANVVLEAMAVGLFVISTDCGGMDEVVIDGETGFLVPRRNPLEIANAIKRYCSLSTEEKTNIVVKARKRVEREHQDWLMVREMLNLYEAIKIDASR